MKRVKIWGSLIALAAILSGCFFEPAESLYAVPKQSADFYDLQNAIERAMPEGANYSPPTAGENQQAVQLADLDGDNVDEAIVYIKKTGDSPLGVYVFDKTGDRYSLVAKIEGAGSAFDHVQYVQIDDMPGYEIVIGRQISDQVSQLLGVYTLRNGTLMELMSTDYSAFITTDLDGNGRQDVFVLRGDGDTQNGIAELYRWTDGQLAREREATLSTGVASIKRIITGNMCAGVPAVFVASAYGENSGIITDIYGFSDGVFTNFSKSDETGASVKTVRDYYVYSCDIDSDGLIELPHLIPLPALVGDENSKNQSLICWYNLLTDGTEQKKKLTYHNYSGGWYLEIPEAWEGRVAVTRGAGLGSALGYCFLWRGLEKSEELLTIAALSGEHAAQTIRQENWTTLMQKGDIIYACHIGDSGIQRGLTYDKLRDMFHFIQVDWKTGET